MILYEDNLIHQWVTASGKIATKRKRLPNNSPEIHRQIAKWLKEEKGSTIPVVKRIKDSFQCSLHIALEIFKEATGVTNLKDRWAYLKMTKEQLEILMELKKRLKGKCSDIICPSRILFTDFIVWTCNDCNRYFSWSFDTPYDLNISIYPCPCYYSSCAIEALDEVIQDELNKQVNVI